ncbi:hypothetical protein BdWA1_001285 [Babesia duncani]|uniref:Uncharacterized protein n=1 Tax=Babesia duncani TaxID=323732 RepID=A0AAD9PPB4_9APIC|nr:hypothetical protein BdWA1_001285 [Babesia duncani]
MDNGFQIECFGASGGRVLRYLPGSIVREPKPSNYLDALDEESNVNPLELARINAENWHIPASMICMAASLWSQTDSVNEWKEALVHHQKANEHLLKANETLAKLTRNELSLRHTVSSHDTNSKCLKYAIYERNEKLSHFSNKVRDLATYLQQSLELQVQFLEIVALLKSRFIVLVNARNTVDISSIDFDFPGTFAIAVVFFNINFNIFPRNEFKIWSLWQTHKHADPFAPQTCHISYYESTQTDASSTSNELSTKIIFPAGIGHFIQRRYTLTINGVHAPVYQDSNIYGVDSDLESKENTHGRRICMELQEAQMCLIDRLAFCILSQYCYDHFINSCPIKTTSGMAHVKSLNSDYLELFVSPLDIKIAYEPVGHACGVGAIWKCLITKLRLLVINSWKSQVFQTETELPNILEEFLDEIYKRVGTPH